MARKTDTAALEELKELQAKSGGVVHPEAVVEFAKDENTALHDHFEWDDNKAGHQYRLSQARRILRVYVQVLDIPDKELQTRVFVSLKSDRVAGGGYRALVDVLSDEERRAQLLQDALDELRFFTRKYKELSELDGVFNAISEVTQRAAGTDRPTNQSEARPGV